MRRRVLSSCRRVSMARYSRLSSPCFISTTGQPQQQHFFSTTKSNNESSPFEITTHNPDKNLGVQMDSEEDEIAELQSNIQECWFSGNAEEGIEIALKCLEKTEKVLGREHPAYSSVLNNLGMFNKRLGNFDKASEYLTDAIQGYKKVVGGNHKNTILALGNLGSVYKAMAATSKGMEKHVCLENAKTAYEDVLKAQEATLDKDDIQLAITKQNLGAVHGYSGDRDKGLALTLAGHETIASKGQQSEQYAVSLNNVGLIYKNRSEFTEAKKYYDQALELRTEISGESHEQTILVMSNLAELAFAQGDEDGGLKIQREILSRLGYTQEDLDKFEREMEAERANAAEK